MQKIYLSNYEKAILKALKENPKKAVEKLKLKFSNKMLYHSAKELKEKEFIRAAFGNEQLVSIALLPKAEAYLEKYPKLRNPITEQKNIKFNRYLSVAALIISLLALALNFFRSLC